MNLKTATPREIAEFIVNKDGDNDPVEVFRATRWWGLNMARRKQLNPDFTKLAHEAASFVSGLEIQDTYAANRRDDHTMHTFPDPTPELTATGATRLLEYYKSKGLSLEMAQRIVDDSPAMATPPEPTDADHISAKIVAQPDKYTPGLRALAKAYESRGERIADLEEDVERLKVGAPFTPKTLFECEADGIELQLETQCRGGLTITHRGDDGDYRSVLTALEGVALAIALNDWSGVDGVEWREIKGKGKPDDIKDLVDVLLSDGTKIGIHCWCPDWSGWNWVGRDPTHWAPLPKPPVVKS